MIELKVQPHTISRGKQVIEVWKQGVFLATITGSDDTGVRIITKHHLDVSEIPDPTLEIIEITITP